jgi:hypothetical protein
LGKKRRGCEATLPVLALFCGTARGSGAFAVGGAENRSGMVCAERRVAMMRTMPPAADRGNGRPLVGDGEQRPADWRGERGHAEVRLAV